MSTFFSKLFPGSSSSSSSNTPAAPNTELTNMDSLCNAINKLMKDSTNTDVSYELGEKAAQIVRKNRDLFEKKFDVEAFLIACSPTVGSAAMVAAIKSYFDNSFAKGNDAGADRAVELLNHYIMEQKFVGEHLVMVPELIFPLLRCVGLYCLEKKEKPEIGQQILLNALKLMFPRYPGCPKVLTSCHGALFACALKTKNYAEVEPFIDPYLDDVTDEKSFADPPDDQMIVQAAMMYKKFPKSSMSALQNQGSTSPFVNPKYVLEYLLNGASILIEMKRYEDALLLLDVLVSIPAYTVTDNHVEGYKKYVLLSLLLHGKVTDGPDKHMVSRNVKSGKNNEYKSLADIRFSRTGNTHSLVENIVNNAKDRLKKEGNLDLARLVVLEMKKKTIIALVKMFSTIRLPEVTELAFLRSRQQTTELMESLVREKRITVKMEGEMVFWSEVSPVPSKEDIEKKMQIVERMNRVLAKKNMVMKHGNRSVRPSMIYHDDEGLSMNPIDN